MKFTGGVFVGLALLLAPATGMGQGTATATPAPTVTEAASARTPAAPAKTTAARAKTTARARSTAVAVHEAPGPRAAPQARSVIAPSLRDTGRMGAMKDASLLSNAPQIKATSDVADSGEKSVKELAVDTDREVPEPSGTINSARLAVEIQQRFAALDACRVDAARRKRVAPSEVRATTLTLRWVIVPNGQAASTQVVATGPTDLEVMDCVKELMSGWTFTGPRGGAVHVERAFRFRDAR